MDKKRELREQLNQIADDAGDNLDRAGEYTSTKISRVVQSLADLTVLSHSDGKAVQEILNRYLYEELRPALKAIVDTNGGSIAEEASIAGLTKDIDYITGLAKLFD